MNLFVNRAHSVTITVLKEFVNQSYLSLKIIGSYTSVHKSDYAGCTVRFDSLKITISKNVHESDPTG